MKVIFLDIDGVLVTRKHMLFLAESGYEKMVDANNDEKFDPICVANLGKLIEETGAKIVVSSTWRYMGVGPLQKIFRDRKVSGEIIGLTTIERFEDDSKIYAGECRGRQIQEYLEDHPEIENYVIIDDDSDMMECQLDNFVHTKFEDGFIDSALEKAIKILKNEKTTNKTI
jgi:hypothetical protein